MYREVYQKRILELGLVVSPFVVKYAREASNIPAKPRGKVDIRKSVGQQVGQLVAALGIGGLAQVLIETLSDADIDRLSERLRMPECHSAT